MSIEPRRGAVFKQQAHHDVLVVVAEALAEDVDAAGMAGAVCDPNPQPDRLRAWSRRLAPWSEIVRDFRSEGFYERFPAKGQVERVARIHRELGRTARIEPERKKA